MGTRNRIVRTEPRQSQMAPCFAPMPPWFERDNQHGDWPPRRGDDCRAISAQQNFIESVGLRLARTSSQHRSRQL